jgi:ElaB/YqjD/DUF883 family membrane-anchored ribosome-binding protein
MAQGVLDDITETTLGNCTAEEFARLKEVITDAVEDGLRAARHTIKQGREVAEEAMDEAVHAVKKYPLQTVAVTFGVALATGALLGWLACRRD